MSEIKKSKDKSYFDGEISIGKASIHVSGYNEGVQKKVQFYKDSKSSVTINNCQVTKSRVSDELEVKSYKFANFRKCKKVFKVLKNSLRKCGKEINLSDLMKMENFQQVTACLHW